MEWSTGGGEEGLFFHSVRDANGTMQWLKAAERLMNTQPNIINHSLVLQEVVEGYLNSCVRTNVLFLSFQFAQLTWPMSDVKLQISEHRCSVWFSVFFLFFFPHHKTKSTFRNSLRTCITPYDAVSFEEFQKLFWSLCEQRLRTVSHTWGAKRTFRQHHCGQLRTFQGVFTFAIILNTLPRFYIFAFQV